MSGINWNQPGHGYPTRVETAISAGRAPTRADITADRRTAEKCRAFFGRQRRRIRRRGVQKASRRANR